MSGVRSILCAVVMSLSPVLPAIAQDVAPSGESPKAPARSHLQNYKDMVLATCVAMAYRQNPQAAGDAGSSVSALRDWTEYDLDRAPDEIKQLVDRYLAKDYRNPLAEAESPGQRFDFLKCLDLYHSTELDTQAKKLVMHPKRKTQKR